MPTNATTPNNQKPMTWNDAIRQLYPPSKPHSYTDFVKKCLIATFVNTDSPTVMGEFINHHFTEEEAQSQNLISDEALDALADFIFDRINSVGGNVYQESRVKELIVLYTEQDHLTGEVLIEAYRIQDGCEFFKTRQAVEDFIKQECFDDAQVEIEFIKTLQRDY